MCQILSANPWRKTKWQSRLENPEKPARYKTKTNKTKTEKTQHNVCWTALHENKHRQRKQDMALLQIQKSKKKKCKRQEKKNKKIQKKHNTICVRHHYTQTSKNNVNKKIIIQTAQGNDEPNIVFLC